MGLQFIFGNSGAGKSSYLYQTVIEESLEHPTENYLVLVPEQFTMQTQKDLCMAHPRHGIMNIDVLSFVRLIVYSRNWDVRRNRFWMTRGKI